jgi:hypothetical protein
MQQSGGAIDQLIEQHKQSKNLECSKCKQAAMELAGLGWACGRYIPDKKGYCNGTLIIANSHANTSH